MSPEVKKLGQARKMLERVLATLKAFDKRHPLKAQASKEIRELAVDVKFAIDATQA